MGGTAVPPLPPHAILEMAEINLLNHIPMLF